MASIHDILRGDIIPESGVDVSVGRNSLDFPSPVVPVLDVHLRQTDFHDSGAPTQSGILYYNSEDEHLELIPSQSGAAAITTAVYIDTYNTATQRPGSLDTNTTTQALEVTRSLSDVTHFTLQEPTPGDFFVSIWGAGIYEMTYRASLESTGTSRVIVRSWIEVDTGAGYVEPAAARSFSYHRDSVDGVDTGYTNIIVSDIVPGTKVRCRLATNNTGAAGFGPITITEECSLTIKRLA
jgi:hypothetical protein